VGKWGIKGIVGRLRGVCLRFGGNLIVEGRCERGFRGGCMQGLNIAIFSKNS
jgi:hypothetical protein